jgi:predicted DNA-binding mobile mystery protein A
MPDWDLLRMQQLETTLQPFRQTADLPTPPHGWIRAIREALGMTSAQLARRLGRKASQSVTDIQDSETLGTIKLNTLREAAEAMGCRLVYAIVPVKPIDELRRERALDIARRTLGPATHSMRLEAQGLGPTEEQRAQDRLVEELLRTRPRRLWD